MASPPLPDPTNANRDTPTLKASESTVHVGSSVFIAAPAQKVFEALTDISTWPQWNGFVPRVTLPEQPSSSILQQGTRMTFHVQMNPEKPNPEKPNPEKPQDVGLIVTECSPPNEGAGRIVWVADHDAAGAFSPSMLAAEREHEIKAVEGGTELRNWENQAGWLAYPVKWMYGKQLEKNFQLWVEQLKEFVEGQNES